MKRALLFALFAACGAKKEKEQILPFPPPQEPVSEIFLDPISELPQKPDSKQPTLINGRAAEPKDWPASVYSSQGNSRCTATVVGERVLMIAAHCVSNGGKASFKIKGAQYSSICTHSSDYRRNSTADYALCAVDKVVEGIPYEVLNQDAEAVKVGDELLLTGFGCVQPGGGGGNDGVYRIGEAKISRTPRGTDNDIVTGGPAALCFGDSGGPAFKIVGEKRWQVSINSRGDIRRTSYLSALHTAQAKEFIASWYKENNHKICGVHADAKGCRNTVSPPPSPSPSPEPIDECKKAYEKVGLCMKGQAEASEDSCWKAYARLFQCIKE